MPFGTHQRIQNTGQLWRALRVSSTRQLAVRPGLRSPHIARAERREGDRPPKGGNKCACTTFIGMADPSGATTRLVRRSLGAFSWLRSSGNSSMANLACGAAGKSPSLGLFLVHLSIQPSTSRYHWRLFFGWSTQWFSFGLTSRRDGMSRRWSAVKAANPLRVGNAEVLLAGDHQHRSLPLVDEIDRVPFLECGRILIIGLAAMFPFVEPQLLGLVRHGAGVEHAVMLDDAFEPSRAICPRTSSSYSRRTRRPARRHCRRRAR